MPVLHRPQHLQLPQHLRFALQAVLVEALHGDAHAAQLAAVDGAEAALADAPVLREVVRGCSQLLRRKRVQVPVRRRSPPPQMML